MSLPIRTFWLKIPSGESLSEALSLELWVPVSVAVPPTIVGNFLSFQTLRAIKDNAGVATQKWCNVFDDDGDESAIKIPDTLDDGAVLGLNTRRAGLEAVRWASAIKVRAGLSSVPSVQTEDIYVAVDVKELHLV